MPSQTRAVHDLSAVWTRNSFEPTHTAMTLAAFHVGVFSRVGVSLWAALSGSRGTALHVDLVSDRLQVRGIHTRRVPTQVVQFLSRRHLAAEYNKGVDMRQDHSTGLR